ncbi:MAG: polysaccharide deacetylase [Bifidobacteriaceae bacterium]|jgi:peptidoglycan/xylan/chitin deacetylase (PgdA/CDA1 family)|nr:polysaccharide deacetylase [Bifidobacteriaceae bacterium]
MGKDITVVLSVEVEAVAGWPPPEGTAASPSDLQRGIFAVEVGIPRLLKLFERADVFSTWFIAGHAVETFPEQCRAVVDNGHEVGAHGYGCENPAALSPQQEAAIMDQAVGLISRLAGHAPQGYSAPGWQLSPRTPALLRQHGFTYDHSQQHKDFAPYYLRLGEAWLPPDLANCPAGSAAVVQARQDPDLVEIPANWYLDDRPPLMYARSRRGTHGFVSPRVIEDMWKQQFEWVYRHLQYAVFPITLHPEVSGRPQCLMMLERLIAYFKTFEAVRFTTMAEAAAAFRRRFPASGTERPAEA